MAFETEDGVVFTQEGERTRARAGSLSYLFPIPDPRVAKEDYLRCFTAARDHYKLRWEAAATSKIPADALAAFAQEVALNAMYLYAINGQPIVLTPGDLDHPQARRILRDHAKRYLRAGSKAELAFCAGVLGESVEAFQRWIEGERRFQDR